MWRDVQSVFIAMCLSNLRGDHDLIIMHPQCCSLHTSRHAPAVRLSKFGVMVSELAVFLQQYRLFVSPRSN